MKILQMNTKVLNEQELLEVDGGIDWNAIGTTVAGVAGGIIGGVIAAAKGGEAGAGVLGYTIFDK